MKKKNTVPVEPPEPQEVERSETSAGAGGSTGARGEGGPGDVPDPEVEPRSKRRRFSPAYKRRILEEADACTHVGDIGALLRREGLYSSHLGKWRQMREQGTLTALAPKRRGPKPDPDRSLVKHNETLERENARLRKKLDAAETIIDVQRKLSRLLGIEMPESSENDA